jgi:hypothetical protein
MAARLRGFQTTGFGEQLTPSVPTVLVPKRYRGSDATFGCGGAAL